jgi:uncharacterized protein
LHLVLDVLALLAAGVLAGFVGTAGGITSSISYPALLAVGLPPLSANIANNIALVACWPGSAFASRMELAGRTRWLARWSALAILGGGTGAGLLLLTPESAFERIVPFLMVGGSLVLLFEPRLSARRQRGRSAERSWLLPATLLVVTLYNGYFGGGSGVMTLTLLLVFVDPQLPTANALKNMIIGASQTACAVVFTAGASIRWSAALPLAAGMLIGSNLGPRVTRRLPARLMRFLIVLFTVTVAVCLWIDPRF